MTTAEKIAIRQRAKKLVPVLVACEACGATDGLQRHHPNYSARRAEADRLERRERGVRVTIAPADPTAPVTDRHTTYRRLEGRPMTTTHDADQWTRGTSNNPICYHRGCLGVCVGEVVAKGTGLVSAHACTVHGQRLASEVDGTFRLYESEVPDASDYGEPEDRCDR